MIDGLKNQLDEIKEEKQKLEAINGYNNAEILQLKAVSSVL